MASFGGKELSPFVVHTVHQRQNSLTAQLDAVAMTGNNNHHHHADVSAMDMLEEHSALPPPIQSLHSPTRELEFSTPTRPVLGPRESYDWIQHEFDAGVSPTRSRSYTYSHPEQYYTGSVGGRGEEFGACHAGGVMMKDGNSHSPLKLLSRGRVNSPRLATLEESLLSDFDYENTDNTNSSNITNNNGITAHEQSLGGSAPMSLCASKSAPLSGSRRGSCSSTTSYTSCTSLDDMAVDNCTTSSFGPNTNFAKFCTPTRKSGGLNRQCEAPFVLAENFAQSRHDVGWTVNVGRKNEDNLTIQCGTIESHFLPRPLFVEIFAVFDGHRCKAMSEFAAQKFSETFRDSLIESLCDGQNSSTFEEQGNINAAAAAAAASAACPPPALVDRALEQSFFKLHEGARESQVRGGATALAFVCVQYADVAQGQQCQYCTCGNAGDTRAVLSRGGRAERLSVDHKACEESERRRVEAGGGTVEFDSLDGMLEVSRGIGDFDFERSGFIPEPHMPEQGFLLPDESCEFVILASDGVWDVISDNEAVQIAHGAFMNGKNAQHVSDYLAELARSRGTKDDITAIVLGFQ